jgi:predicted nucleic acid-binding protein
LAGHQLRVPAHFDAEVYSALRRHRRMGGVTAARLDALVSLLAEFTAQRVALSGLLVAAHGLGERFSSSDSLYVALSQLQRADLVTADSALARAATGVIPVRLISPPSPAAPSSAPPS